MALNIKDENTHELARELARRRGTTLTKAVTDALSEALDRSIPPAPAALPKLVRLQEISRRTAKLPVLDPRSPEEILGYDELGMPT